MRLAHVAILGLTLSCGCLRFGYDARRSPIVLAPDAAPHVGGADASSMDAGALPDASAPDAEARDASAPAADGGASSLLDAGLDAATDAGWMDAAVMDAAAQDAGMEAGMEAGAVDPCLGRSGLLFCDGFEDPALASWGAPVATNGSVERSTSRQRSGTASLHAATGAANGASSAARHQAQVFGHIKKGELWARAFYYLPSSVVIDTFFATLRAAELEPPSFGCSLVVRAGNVELGGVTTRFTTSSPFPRDQWTCVELHIVIDANAGVCEAYVDGMIATQSPMVDTLPAMGYTTLDVGIQQTDTAQGPVEVFVDDVAAGPTRVGCD